MNPLHLGYLALEIAQQRSREAAEHQLAVTARQGDRHDRRTPPPAGPLRRSIARGAAAVSRSAADLARRLDGPTGEELAEWPRPRSSSLA